MRTGTRHVASVLYLTALAALLAGCGYNFVSKGSISLPEGVRNLTLSEVDNPTMQTWIPAEFAAHFRDELTDRGQVRWTSPGRADADVALSIDRYYVSSDLTDDKDRTVKFAANITVSALIRRKSDRKVLFDSGPVSVIETYYTKNRRAAAEQALSLAARRLADRLGGGY